MSCVADCGDASISVMDYDDSTIDGQSPNKIDLVNLNKCNDDATTNTLLEAPPAFHDDSYGNDAIKCKNWITRTLFLISNGDKLNYTNVNPNATNNHSWVEHPLDVYNFVSCPDYNVTYKVDGAVPANVSSVRSDCQLFYRFASSPEF